MESQSMRLEYKVGIFVGLGLILLLTSILMVGGKKLFLTHYAHLRTQFSEVQGLYPGSVVSLAGMPVGNVAEINFVQNNNKVELVLQIDSRYEGRLVEGMNAEVRTQGALGDKYVYLSPGTVSGKRLAENEMISSVENDYFKLLTDRKDGAAAIIDVIKEVRTLVVALNADNRAGKTMTNMADATDKLKKTMDQLNGLIGDLRGEMPHDKKLQKAIASLSSVLEKIDSGKGTIGQLINDPSLHQSLKAFLGASPRNRYMKDMIRESIQQNESHQSK